MYQIQKDSYYWTSLEGVLYAINDYHKWFEPDEPDVVKIIPYDIKDKTLEQYLTVGLENALKHGYNLRREVKDLSSEFLDGRPFNVLNEVDLEGDVLYLTHIDYDKEFYIIWDDKQKRRILLKIKDYPYRVSEVM